MIGFMDQSHVIIVSYVGAAQSLESTMTLVIGGVMYRLIPKEKCSCGMVSAMALTVAGVFLVIQPDFTPKRFITSWLLIFVKVFWLKFPK